MKGSVFIVTASRHLPPYIEADTVPGDRPIVTAAVVPYTEQGEIVMFRHENGLIEFLGGHMEAGESVEDGVRREAMEEGGVVLEKNLRLIGYLVFDGDRPSYNPLYVGRVDRFAPIPPGTESLGRLVFREDEVIEAILNGPEHDWKRRHVEMMESALAAIQALG